MYHARKLTITQLSIDNEFACVEDDTRPVKLNMVAAGEHVGNIKRSNRTVKEGTSYHVHVFPY